MTKAKKDVRLGQTALTKEAEVATRYLDRFCELFEKLTGTRAEGAVSNTQGWLYVPPRAKGDDQVEEEFSILRMLGWKPITADDNYAGGWVRPWPNLEAKSFIALTLTSDGTGKFKYLPDAKLEERYPYYVHRIETGGVTGGPMLLGQFLSELEDSHEALMGLDGGGTNRIYYPCDKRIASYSPLTSVEVAEVRERLVTLTSFQPQAALQRLAEIIQTLPA